MCDTGDADEYQIGAGGRSWCRMLPAKMKTRSSDPWARGCPVGTPMTAWNMSRQREHEERHADGDGHCRSCTGELCRNNLPVPDQQQHRETATGTTAHIFTVMPNPSSSPATIGCGVRSAGQ